MPNTVGSLVGTLANGSLSNIYTTPTTGTMWSTPCVTVAPPPMRYYPATTPLSALRLAHTMLMVCQECGDTAAPTVEKLRCEYCERSYDGSVSLRKVVIAHEEVGVVIQEGKCPDCGCHNMSRIEATRICKCGTPEVFYLPTYRDDLMTVSCAGTTSSSTGDYLHYIQMPSATSATTISSVWSTYTHA